MEMLIQVNGKTLGKIEVEDKTTPAKLVVVQGKLINIVIQQNVKIVRD